MDNYLKCHVSSLEESSIRRCKQRADFFKEFAIYKMEDVSPFFIDDQKKMVSLNLKKSRRYSFKEELKFLRAFCNWYQENYDHTFSNPVLKRHFKLGQIKEKVDKDKKVPAAELIKFFSVFEKSLYRDMAIVQFYLAARIQEVAGLQVKNVYFDEGSLDIKEVVVWGKDKKFFKLKSRPKNGEIKRYYMSDQVREILKRRIDFLPRGCSFVFNDKANPLHYRQIQYYYNRALRRCGLSSRYSGTHFLRHSMATITRTVTGSLEATQAVTGHKDQRMVEHYATLPAQVQVNAVIQVEKYMSDLENLQK